MTLFEIGVRVEQAEKRWQRNWETNHNTPTHARVIKGCL